MESETKNLILIVGPTGVGKSTTGIFLAGRIGGEIINCDSMQVYKGFDIGTDKPSPEEFRQIPHYLLDIVDSSTQFTAADFIAAALEAIALILGKKKIPLIVGGTGLYFKALLNGLFPGAGKDPAIRAELEKEAREKGLEFLGKKLEAQDPAYAGKIGKRDKIRIIRALEVYALTRKPISEHFRNTRSSLKDFHVIKIGLQLERTELYRRIEKRVDRMFERGLVREVESLLRQGVEENAPPFRALGYKYVLKCLKKEITLEEAVALTKKDTRHYAKRQMTWFHKIEGVSWFFPDDRKAILSYVEDHLR
ncbi:MAG: tRNA (adenosine(37)-N6)-dimethylallyltransferase MiaA [Candidatus Aminicenantales bacterium]